MRLLIVWGILLCLSIIGFSVALANQPDEVEAITALRQADSARAAFVSTYNDWAIKHDAYTTSVADRERFKKVRKAWKEFDRLSRNVEY